MTKIEQIRRKIKGKQIYGTKCDTDRDAAKQSDEILRSYEKENGVVLKHEFNFGRRLVNFNSLHIGLKVRWIVFNFTDL